MINFYHRFLRSAARVLAPLKNTLKGPGKSLTWTPTLDSAFSTAKLAKLLLSAVPVLTHPVPGVAVSLLHQQRLLRCVLGDSAAAGTSISKPSSVHVSSRDLSSWCSSFQEAFVLQVCVALPRKGRRPLGEVLPTLPAE